MFFREISTSNKLKNVTWTELILDASVIYGIFFKPILILLFHVETLQLILKYPTKPKRWHASESVSDDSQNLAQTTLNNYDPPGTVCPIQHLAFISSQQPGEVDKGETRIMTAVSRNRLAEKRSNPLRKDKTDNSQRFRQWWTQNWSGISLEHSEAGYRSRAQFRVG